MGDAITMFAVLGVFAWGWWKLVKLLGARGSRWWVRHPIGFILANLAGIGAFSIASGVGLATPTEGSESGAVAEVILGVLLIAPLLAAMYWSRRPQKAQQPPPSPRVVPSPGTTPDPATTQAVSTEAPPAVPMEEQPRETEAKPVAAPAVRAEAMQPAEQAKRPTNKALIACKDCGEHVSKKAKSCPHCGVSSPGVTAQDMVAGWVVLIVIGLVIFAIFAVGGKSPDATSEAAAEVAEGRSAGEEASESTPTEESGPTAEELAAAEEACRKSGSCWAERHRIAAEVYCKPEVERLAKYDHEWTDGWFGHKFSRGAFLDEEKGTLMYFGDQLRLQNGFGAYQNYVYRCDFDPETNTVLAVNAEPGRL